MEPSEQQITTGKAISITFRNVPSKVTNLYCSFQFPSFQRINVTATIKDNG